MRSRHSHHRRIIRTLLVAALPAAVLGSDVLKTNGFTACINNPSITVNTLDIQYDRSAAAVTFNVGGTSTEVQNVTASLTVTAYGKEVYRKDFDPCDDATKVKQLCPGKFHRVSALVSCYADSKASSSCREFRGQRYPNNSSELCYSNPINSIFNT